LLRRGRVAVAEWLANRNARDHGSYARRGGRAAELYGSLEELTIHPRYGDRDNFPGSALITITSLAVPGAKIEIQGYAVLAASETSKVIERACIFLRRRMSPHLAQG
jgi:hypothetical protein